MHELKLKFLSTVNCRCPKGTETDDPEGRCCVFPFVYGPKGIGAERTYYDCTVFKHDRFWCSLDAHYKGRWANCGKGNTESVKKIIKKNKIYQVVGFGATL